MVALLYSEGCLKHPWPTVSSTSIFLLFLWEDQQTQPDTVPCLWKERLPQGENLSSTVMSWGHVWLSTEFFDTPEPHFPYLQHREPCLDSQRLRLQRGPTLYPTHSYSPGPPVSLPSWAASTSHCRPSRSCCWLTPARAQWQQKTPRALQLLGRRVGRLRKCPGGSM